ncbi:MAG: hypothetical protein AAGF72_02315 [Pseudomonadota bacterium]
MRASFLLLLLLAPAAFADEPLSVDATVLLFDDGLADVAPDDTVFPAVRRVEALLWSYSLSQQLRASAAFDIVRIAARPDDLTELTVTGKIAISNGQRIAVDIVARDSLGNAWLSQRFEAESGDDDALIAEVARSVEAEVLAKDTATLRRIREVALLRYGVRLAPTAFGDFLSEDESGRVTVERLPSRDDPMVARLQRVREATFLVSDVIDEKFRELGSEISNVYRLWGEYLAQNQDYQQENLRRAEASDSLYKEGTFEAYKRVYDVYKWHRQTVQEQDKLAVAFGNEVNPRFAGIDERVEELLTWMDSKNAEWYRLLEALFEVETRRETL